MTVTLNGAERDIQPGCTVAALLEQLGLDPKTVVAQVNDEIVERAAFAAAVIREGDTVRIQKAGEIIPQVLGVVPAKRPADAKPFGFEARLKELGLDATRDGEEAAYKLRAPSREMKIRRLVHFASKQCLDIDGLGDAVKLLVGSGPAHNSRAA